jgi:hypothetical protein
VRDVTQLALGKAEKRVRSGGLRRNQLGVGRHVRTGMVSERWGRSVGIGDLLNQGRDTSLRHGR